MNNLINSSLEKLKEKNIPNAELDLRVLLNYSKYSKNEIILSNFDVTQINIDLFNKLLNRRLANEPISKIINKKYFWKDDFYVNKFVLDPRPETEGIVEESLKLITNKKSSSCNISREIFSAFGLSSINSGKIILTRLPFINL